ncbi:MAG: hypothetical protein ACREUU_01005, partial [Gammaproteobacteria bacterium]
MKRSFVESSKSPAAVTKSGSHIARGGSGYLRKTIRGWNRAAQGVPFVVLTDLDQHECPAALLGAWLPEPRHANLVFRIAVREVEAWLLADVENLASFLKVRSSAIPRNPDAVLDPKGALIGAARRSRSAEVR